MVELLLVEDDDRFVHVVSAVLAPRFTLRTTARARVALDWLTEGLDVSLAIIDLGLPDADGVDLLRAIRSLRPSLPAIVLTVDDTSERVLAALDAGASGYVLKEHVVRELASAADATLAGETWLSPRAASHVIHARRNPGPTEAIEAAPVLLTTMERRVLDELARGLSYAQIGIVLGISVNTVRSRIRTLFDKLGAASSTEAIALAAQRGLLRLGA
jgi:DNA-binding NarL/FixJ family response regulator